MEVARDTAEIANTGVTPPQGLVVENLVKVYKAGVLEVLALRGLSMTIPPGKIVVIMGPSGCGKTTLLNLVGGLDVPTAGMIRLGADVITKMPPLALEQFRQEKVGFVFQFMNLVPILTAAENVALPLQIAGKPKREVQERVAALLQLVNLADRKGHRPEELSGGEQQRVAIAAALANDPALLLCDEPTGELDSANKKEIMKVLHTLITENPSKIMLIVTHDFELQEIADIVLHIRDGIIVDRIEGEALAIYKAQALKTTAGDAQKAALQLRDLKKKVGEITKQIQDLEQGN